MEALYYGGNLIILMTQPAAMYSKLIVKNYSENK